MAAAATAAARGADVLVLDEQPGPGGQIYRGANAPEGANDAILGDAYGRGRESAGAMRDAGVTHVPGATGWQGSPDR